MARGADHQRILISAVLIFLTSSKAIGAQDNAHVQQRPTAYNREVVVDIEDSNKTQYHEQNFDTNAYVFGYELGPDQQFHHENRGPDGVTYGCYGIIENDTSIRATHYIADDYGYRIITPGDKIEVFTRSENGGDELQVNEVERPGPNQAPGDHHSKLKVGKFTPWGQLYFPKGCNSFRAPNGTIVYLPGVPKVDLIIDKQASSNTKTVTSFPVPKTKPGKSLGPQVPVYVDSADGSGSYPTYPKPSGSDDGAYVPERDDGAYVPSNDGSYVPDERPYIHDGRPYIHDGRPYLHDGRS